MELIFGVAVTGSTAHLALVDASDARSVLDQSQVDISSSAIERLQSTITETDRMLAQDGHRLVATRVSWGGDPRAAELRDALLTTGSADVSLVSMADAATAWVRSVAGDAGVHTAALLLVDEDTAALSVVGPDAATTGVLEIEPVAHGGPAAAATAVLDRFREEPSGVETVYLIDTSGGAAAVTAQLSAASPVPMRTEIEPAFAVARGAAFAAAADSAATAMATAVPDSFATGVSPQQGDQLAYSMADDSDPSQLDYSDVYEESSVPTQSAMAVARDFDEPTELAASEPTVARPRFLLVGSAAATMVGVAFAILAVVVAITIQPTASEQAIRDNEAVAGKFLPVMPGQGIDPPPADAAVYVPVVPVSANQIITRPAVAPSNPSNAGTPNLGTGPVVNSSPGINPSVATSVVTDTGLIQQLPIISPNQFQLGQWLPTGLNFDYGPMFSAVQQCKAGDYGCASWALGCWPGDAQCLTKKWGCLLGSTGCGTVITPVEPPCQKGDPTCDPTALTPPDTSTDTSTESSTATSTSEDVTSTEESPSSSSETPTETSTVTSSSPTSSTTTSSSPTSSSTASSSTSEAPTETSTSTVSSTTSTATSSTVSTQPPSTEPPSSTQRSTSSAAPPPPLVTSTQPPVVVPEPEPVVVQPQPQPAPAPAIAPAPEAVAPAPAPAPAPEVVVPTQTVAPSSSSGDSVSTATTSVAPVS